LDALPNRGYTGKDRYFSRRKNVTRFEKWLLKRIIQRIARQGPDHLNNITGVYRIVQNACQEEFTEDNRFTIDAMLKDCYERAKIAAWNDQDQAWTNRNCARVVAEHRE
jgi:hypothetical protein